MYCCNRLNDLTRRLIGTVFIDAKAARVVNLDKKSDLLEFVTTVKLPAISHFDPANFFKKDSSVFEDFNGKIETLVPACDIRVSRLLKGSLEKAIRDEIGADKAETTLGQFMEMLRLQPNAKEGPLLNDGRANLFYIRNKNGVLRVLNVRAGLNAWDIIIHYTDCNGSDATEWDIGYQVISR